MDKYIDKLLNKVIESNKKPILIMLRDIDFYKLKKIMYEKNIKPMTDKNNETWNGIPFQIDNDVDKPFIKTN